VSFYAKGKYESKPAEIDAKQAEAEMIAKFSIFF